jgi:hypothetical protein
MHASANVLIGGVLDALECRHLDDEIEFVRGNACGRVGDFFALVAQGKCKFDGPAIAAPVACAAVLQAVGQDAWAHVLVAMKQNSLLSRHFLLDESYQRYVYIIDKIGWTVSALTAFIIFLPGVGVASLC